MRALPKNAASLRFVYGTLLSRFGHAGWWPGETAFEVCVGAILVQNTSWANVEKALTTLRGRGLIEFRTLYRLSPGRLAPLIRPSGYFRIKARRLRAFLDFLSARYDGDVAKMKDEDPRTLRQALLAVPGIGRETADSIVLYAAGLPLFVIDAYTRRVFGRLGLVRGDEAYDELQSFFMERLPLDAALYNDFHAQIVTLGKGICRPWPRCPTCPLQAVCPKRGEPSTVRRSRRPRAR